MFKSIESYEVAKNKTGLTINGSGLLTVISSNESTLKIDGYHVSIAAGGSYLFKSSAQFYNNEVGSYNYKIVVTIGLFND